MTGNLLGVSLVLVVGLCKLMTGAGGQQLIANATVVCVNGELGSDGCECYSGWIGPTCAQCGGRIR